MLSKLEGLLQMPHNASKYHMELSHNNMVLLNNALQ